jgi:hypothetical protein
LESEGDLHNPHARRQDEVGLLTSIPINPVNHHKAQPSSAGQDNSSCRFMPGNVRLDLQEH